MRLATLVTLLVATAAPARATHPSASSFVSPPPFGLVAPGSPVAYTLVGCHTTQVRAIVTTEDGEHAGDPSDGCAGTVRIPDEVPDHQILLVALRTDDHVEQPLRLKRIVAEHATVVRGPATPSGDAVEVASGTTLGLGTIDLSGVSSVSVRTKSTGATLCHPTSTTTYCRPGRAIVTADGAVLADIEIEGGSPDRPWTRSVSEPVTLLPPTTADVQITFFVEAPVTVDHIELNGSGVTQPHTFDPDPPGTVTLFDGTSLDGWRQAGGGAFVLEPDGSMRSVSGYGLFWYAARTFGDIVLRLEFKVSDIHANSGVFVRFADPGTALVPSVGGYEVQVQDYGQAYLGSRDLSSTGAIYALSPAERLATRTVGEWNTLEVTAAGQDYTVAIDGRVVNRFTGSRDLEGHIGVQNHDPSGTVWYRDIRVLPV